MADPKPYTTEQLENGLVQWVDLAVNSTEPDSVLLLAQRLADAFRERGRDTVADQIEARISVKKREYFKKHGKE